MPHKQLIPQIHSIQNFDLISIIFIFLYYFYSNNVFIYLNLLLLIISMSVIDVIHIISFLTFSCNSCRSIGFITLLLLSSSVLLLNSSSISSLIVCSRFFNLVFHVVLLKCLHQVIHLFIAIRRISIMLSAVPLATLLTAQASSTVLVINSGLFSIFPAFVCNYMLSLDQYLLKLIYASNADLLLFIIVQLLFSIVLIFGMDRMLENS